MDKWKNALHEAIYVHVDEFNVYVWHGGTYINIYDKDYNALDCIGLQDENRTMDKVKDTIERHIKEDE